MLKKLLIGVLAIVAIVLSIAARQGATYQVERHIDIRATPARIVPLARTLRLNSAAGKASTRLADVIAATSTSRVTLTPQGATTRVTWRMYGRLSLRTRLITSFIGMDILLGSELEKGLANVKAAAEK
ncbi:MAG: hypothetical protein M3Y65_17975 [Pseudomonadota bacterium]|nr:hypothetical protein [Pseudomonadota bacterium]